MAADNAIPADGLESRDLTQIENREIHDTIRILNEMIQNLADGEEGFKLAADRTRPHELMDVFLRHSRQHEQHKTELQKEVTRIGGEAQVGGSVGGALHRGWISLRDALAGDDHQSLINETINGQEATVEKYEECLTADFLLPEAKNMLRSQHEVHRQTLQALRLEQDRHG